MRDNHLDDEWSGLLAIELCLAVMNHNPKKSKLSTYFYMRADSRMKTEYQKTQAKKRLHNGFCQINDEILTCDTSEESMNEFILLEDILEHEHAELIKLRYEGYTQMEIAEKVGMSQANVSYIFQKIKEEYEY